MKIKFRKLEATSTFMKLFGVDRNKSQRDAREAENRDDADDAYEYYYKRGNTYYFRNNDGNKISIDYKEPQNELVRGNKYKMDDINDSAR